MAQSAYSCTVIQTRQRGQQNPEMFGFLDSEEVSYEAEILGFENLKAYVVRLDNKRCYWINIENLTEITRIV